MSDKIRAAVRAFGAQKVLAIETGLEEAALSKLLSEQLPKFNRLLEVLDLEVVERGHVANLRAVLKEVL